MEKEPKVFTIDAMSLDDIEAATHMRLESWLDTYVNNDFGVTHEWIEARNQEQLSSERMERRRERFDNPKTAAWVAKDSHGEVIGVTSPYVDENGTQHVGSLYVDKEYHGSGIAGQLMQRAIEWFDASQPIEVGVVAYIERAKAFYRKWGFMEIPNSEVLFADKIPEVKMIRKGDTQDEV